MQSVVGWAELSQGALNMAKKAKAKGKKARKPAKLTVAQQLVALKADVDQLRALIAGGNKSELDKVPAALDVVSGKLDAIK